MIGTGEGSAFRFVFFAFCYCCSISVYFFVLSLAIFCMGFPFGLVWATATRKVEAFDSFARWVNKSETISTRGSDRPGNVCFIFFLASQHNSKACRA